MFLPQHMGKSLREFLGMPIQEALQSPDPFIRAPGIIDRRIGRRSLERLQIEESAPSFVKLFYELRMKVAEPAQTMEVNPECEFSNGPTTSQ